MFKMRRGEPRVSAHRRYNEVHRIKGHMANSTHWPCGLGCQLLGPCYFTCLGTNLVHDHLLWVRTLHAQHLSHAGQERMTAQNPPATCVHAGCTAQGLCSIPGQSQPSKAYDLTLPCTRMAARGHQSHTQNKGVKLPLVFVHSTTHCGGNNSRHNHQVPR